MTKISQAVLKSVDSTFMPEIPIAAPKRVFWGIAPQIKFFCVVTPKGTSLAQATFSGHV
jgi:hypothetical protein